jgi:hypothetical protein
LAASAVHGLLGLADPDVAEDPVPRLLLRSPRINSSGIQYDVLLPDGESPGRTGACVLFLGRARFPAAAGDAR